MEGGRGSGIGDVRNQIAAHVEDLSGLLCMTASQDFHFTEVRHARLGCNVSAQFQNPGHNQLREMPGVLFGS